jgi:FAD/FMN-containing dehydrogenase
MTNISKEKAEDLKSKVKGQIVVPSDSSYDEVREIWNAMIERRPALIVRCTEADDVPHAILFAREYGLEISIRCAGHNIAGNALCDNGVMIDFSTMRNVRVDAESKRAYVEPGATLANFDEAAQSHGLATPVGINSTTGIAGLTLGGGFGWLTRKYGMTVDNLVSVDVVTTHGARNYWKSHNFTGLSDGALNSMIEFAGKLPSPQCEILIALVAGAANRVPADAMAYRHRNAKFVLNVHGRWDERTDDERCIAWARAFFQASAPYASDGAYVNFMTEEEGDRVAAAYSANYDRLTQIKRQYDPDNRFHLNQNIKPSARGFIGDGGLREQRQMINRR